MKNGNRNINTTIQRISTSLQRYDLYSNVAMIIRGADFPQKLIPVYDFVPPPRGLQPLPSSKFSVLADSEV